MKSLTELISEAKYESIRPDIWDETAEDFVKKLKYADDTGVISESIYNLIDLIYTKSSAGDKKLIKEGIEKWLNEN